MCQFNLQLSLSTHTGSLTAVNCSMAVTWRDMARGGLLMISAKATSNNEDNNNNNNIKKHIHNFAPYKSLKWLGNSFDFTKQDNFLKRRITELHQCYTHF